MQHTVRIINFSLALGTSFEDVEEEMAELLDQGFEIAAATGYSTGQSGPHHGGAFVILVKRDAAGDE
ncbi:MAG: hypothetical protein ACOCXI_03920 [Chloroflexota bacterium]